MNESTEGMGLIKVPPEPQEVYRRIVAGLPGSPMPMSDWAYGEDAWHLTHFVLAKSSAEQCERVEMKKFRIPHAKAPRRI